MRRKCGMGGSPADFTSTPPAIAESRGNHRSASLPPTAHDHGFLPRRRPRRASARTRRLRNSRPSTPVLTAGPSLQLRPAKTAALLRSNMTDLRSPPALPTGRAWMCEAGAASAPARRRGFAAAAIVTTDGALIHQRRSKFTLSVKFLCPPLLLCPINRSSGSSSAGCAAGLASPLNRICPVPGCQVPSPLSTKGPSRVSSLNTALRPWPCKYSR